MTSHELSLDLASALATPRRCPACTTGRLHPVVRDGAVAFLCHACRSLWVWELGTLAPADEAPEDAGPT